MKILIASPYLPWPLSEGGKAAQFRTLEALVPVCEFVLVVPLWSEAEAGAAAEFQRRLPQVRLRPVPLYAPAPEPTAAGIQDPLWLRAARRLRRKLAPVPPETTPAAAAREDLPSAAAVEYPYFPFHKLDPAFVGVLEEELALGCDIFQAEFADMLTLGPWIQGRVPAVFVHHQLHFMYAGRLAEGGVGGDAYARYLNRRMYQEEALYLKNFDAVVVFSATDRRLLQEFEPSLKIGVSPFPAPEEPPVEPHRISAPVQTFVFVASQYHLPNVNGLRWFMNEVWPQIRSARDGARMEVVGDWNETARTQLPHHSEIHFTGFVEDLAGALRGKIMVVPVRVGSGIRTKILAAWSSSCAVVTTGVGVEGLPGEPGTHYLMADDPAAFANACLKLSDHPEIFNGMAGNALALVREHYSLEAVRTARLTVYQQVLSTAHRSSPRP